MPHRLRMYSGSVHRPPGCVFEGFDLLYCNCAGGGRLTPCDRFAFASVKNAAPVSPFLPVVAVFGGKTPWAVLSRDERRAARSKRGRRGERLQTGCRQPPWCPMLKTNTSCHFALRLRALSLKNLFRFIRPQFGKLLAQFDPSSVQTAPTGYAIAQLRCAL